MPSLRKTIRLVCFFVVICSLSLNTACQKDEDDGIVPAGPLALSTSTSLAILEQKADDQTALTLRWTTGTNSGTGSSISYVLQMDKQGNSFANPVLFEMGKAVYEKAFTVADLNSMIREQFGESGGSVGAYEARIIATIYDTPPLTSTSPVVQFSITTYEPVSSTLYLIGSASSAGWDANNAIALIPDPDDPAIFSYRGALGIGEFKFITSLGNLLPSYVRGVDDNHIAYRTSESQPDVSFIITEPAMYRIDVSLLDLTITTSKLDLPAYENIYMVGSAAPNGWDITAATELLQDSDNPFIFSYTGVMNPGEFKFPVNQNGDWGQDMYMMLSDSTMYLHHGGDPDDSKWSIEKKGHYIITLNLSDNTISIKRTSLFVVGSATPIEWNIGEAIELEEDATDGCIFTYTGPMVSGEFKFPVNRNTDWGQDMYMRTSDTEMYRHKGGDPDDNKWNITADGNYVITANVETLVISIQKQ